MHNPGHIVLFVINPVSGGVEKHNWEEEIRGALPAAAEAHFYVQTGKDDKAAITKMLEELKPGKVVAVGGDGTVKMVAELVKETPMILGIVPAGSANGLAKELGIPTDLAEAINVIVNGAETPLDAVCINHKEFCFHLSDAGLNALLVKYFEDYKGRGLWGYGRSLLKMFWNRQVMRVKIETDSETVKRKAYMVALANAEKYGTGAVINPGGKTDDGVFEVVVVRKLKVSEIFKAVTARKNFNPQAIEIFRTTKASLTFQQKAPFQIDGEYMGKRAKAEARIIPGVVKVMRP